jgi:hypothetical protein
VGVRSSVVAAEAFALLSSRSLARAQQEARSSSLSWTTSEEHAVHATIRRYESVDTTRTDELSRKASETLVPKLQKLEGFE